MNTQLVPVVGLVLLLWLPSTLRADNQGVASAARHAGCLSPGGPDKATSGTPCIIDLQPGDVRLFAPSASTAGKLHRWLDLQAATVGTQYVFAKNGLGVTTDNEQNYQVAVRGPFKLDAKGRFTINAGLYTGANFRSGSNNTGLGIGEAQSNLYLKHLYFNALPLDGVESAIRGT